MIQLTAAHKNQTFGVGDFLLNGLHLSIRSLSHTVPYARRIQYARETSKFLLDKFPQNRRRIEDNLNLIFPDRSGTWRSEISDDSLRNIGQSLMEHMHMAEFAERIGNLNITGPGVETLDPERGAILISGHFGQWETVRIAWKHLTGHDCGFFFRPNNNGFYDRHWQKYLMEAGAPVIPKGGDGKAIMENHLSHRGALLMVIDQRMQRADRFDFMGKPARTATTAAELALRFDLPLIPAYGIRRDNLTDYSVVYENPIPPTTPGEMTQALNHSLAERVFTNPEQYLWTHRRWL